MRMPSLRLGLSRPRGLAARAAAWATALILATAALSAGTLLTGAHFESMRRQVQITSDLTIHFSDLAGELVADGNVRELEWLVRSASSRQEVRRLAVYDAQGAIVAAYGGSEMDASTMRELAAEVGRTGAIAHARSGDGGLALGAPIVIDGVRAGVATMMWDGDAYRFQALSALSPFLILVACLALIGVPLTMMNVRRALRPLDALTALSRRIAEQGELASIDIKTGDEFETLASAFNNMTARLDESIRRIQEIAFVDAVTRLPNQDRFAREVDFALLQDGGQVGLLAAFEFKRVAALRQSLEASAARDLLRAVAQHLSTATAAVDKLMRSAEHKARPAMAARLGGEEFAVFAPQLATPTEAARFAQHLTAALNRPFEWRGHKLTLGAACGVALAPRDGGDAAAVLRRARLALGASQTVTCGFSRRRLAPSLPPG